MMLIGRIDVTLKNEDVDNKVFKIIHKKNSQNRFSNNSQNHFQKGFPNYFQITKIGFYRVLHLVLTNVTRIICCKAQENHFQDQIKQDSQPMLLRKMCLLHLKNQISKSKIKVQIESFLI